MIADITYKNKYYNIDLSKPLDISIPLKASPENVNAWYLDQPVIAPVEGDHWIGKVSEGASVNFNNIQFNPHAHGTHTECVGHITPQFHSVNQALQHFFFTAEVITIQPQQQDTDLVITKYQITSQLNTVAEALIIRTLPNKEGKINKKYSHTNWAYLTEEAAIFIRNLGVQHLLIDLPSVDKEKDDGKLLAHKAFWNYPQAPRLHATITELIYVNNAIEDGSYMLNLQIAPFENDASPSKPILYKILPR